MNKKVLVLLPTITLLVTPFLCNVNSYQEVEAYDINSLPTTINLNDASDQVIRNYYSNLNSLGENELKGTNLLKNLKPILKNNQKYYSYDSGSKIWQAYEITDRDWKLSPASEISGYNSSTNTITGYSYGSSATKPGSNPYIHALYINRDVDNHVRAWQVEGGTSTSHGGNNPWCIDREHIWPKSAGFENSASGGARGDLMHLWAGDSYVNSALHSNYYYGYVDTSKTHTDGKNKYSWVSGNLMGRSKTCEGTYNVFEPQDSDKGDIARAVFYMVARYNYLSGSDSDGIDSDNPNLEIVDDIVSWKEKGYQSTTTLTGKIGILSDLLEWNKLDPVDEYEIHRNNLLYNNYTNNRNPFIDFPQWADYIWGNGTNYAKPQSDSINNNDSLLTLSNYSYDTMVNKTFTLSASSSQPGAEFTWTSSDNTILSLDKTTGSQVTVSALKQGSASITVSTTISDVVYSKVCQVTVDKERVLTGIEIASAPKKTEYFINDELDTTGLKVNAVYDDGYKKEITNYAITGFSSTDPGEKTITVTYEGFNATFKVVIKESPIDVFFGLPTPAIIAIGVGAVAIIVVIIIILAKSKKARKVAKKVVKKSTSSSGSKNKSNSKKK